MDVRSNCLCQKNSLFSPVIVFKNETTFKKFNNTVIGQCKICSLLKTIAYPKNKFNSQTTHANFYENNKKLFSKLFQPMVNEIKKIKNKGLVLDIGCSSGILLELLKKEGFRFYGIEPNKKAYLLAKKKFKDKIILGYLSDFIKKNKLKFDVLIYNHVLEHVEEIQEELNLIKKILKPNGLLVIGVPNTRNIIFSLRKKYWEYLVPLEHFWHFTDQYLVSFLKKNEFQTVKIEYINDPRIDYPIIKKLYFYLLSKINKIFKTGELMTIYAKYI